MEIDAACCNTLRFNRPGWLVVEGDVCAFHGERFRGVELLAGGVPCPPFSKAGKQLGKNDERDLFPEAIRLVDEIRLALGAEPSEVGPVLLGRLLEDARRLGIEHLACRIDGSDWPNVHLLESRGFVCVDCSLKMGRTLNDLPENARPSTSPVRVRAYEPTDLEAMQRIAARSHTHNHFYNDPWLERTRSAALFSEWLRRCAAGAAEFILVAEDEDGKVTGFVTALANKALARVVGVAVGIIDYIVVDRDAEGRGIGRALLGAALARLAGDNRFVELRTSHDNYRAVAFYNTAGFRLLATDFVFHRLESEPGKGSEFYVIIPFSIEAEGSDGA